MRKLIGGIRRVAVNWLSLDRMEDRFNVLALNYFFLMIYYTLESVYLNTLLLRISGNDMYVVFTYRCLYFATSAVGNLFCSAFSKRIHPVFAVRAGGMAYAAMFLVLFALTNSLTLPLMYFIGTLSGLAGGIYWAGHNVLLTHYTSPGNRGLGLGICGTIQGILTLVVPLVSGLVIDSMPGMSGYRLMFGVAVATIIIQARFMKRLETVTRSHRPREFLFAFKLAFKRLSLRMMLASEFVRGFRDGVFTFFLNILLFEFISNEFLVGFNSFLSGVLSILGNQVYGKIATQERRPRLTALATTVLFLLACVLLLSLNAGTVVFFTVVNAFCSYFIVNSVMNNSFDLFAGNETLRSVMTELMGFRELALDVGRISGIVVVALFPKNGAGYVYAMLTLIASQYAVPLLLSAMRRIENRGLDKEAPGELPAE
ncbi:MAG: MFS transporter [Oscillospiraceae bacterium]|nr:MFS transporter [Oscillospiraceae bacterium]